MGSVKRSCLKTIISLLENGGSVEYCNGYISLRDETGFELAVFYSLDMLDTVDHIDDIDCRTYLQFIECAVTVTFKELEEIKNNARKLGVFNDNR